MTGAEKVPTDFDSDRVSNVFIILIFLSICRCDLAINNSHYTYVISSIDPVFFVNIDQILL